MGDGDGKFFLRHTGNELCFDVDVSSFGGNLYLHLPPGSVENLAQHRLDHYLDSTVRFMHRHLLTGGNFDTDEVAPKDTGKLDHHSLYFRCLTAYRYICRSGMDMYKTYNPNLYDTFFKEDRMFTMMATMSICDNEYLISTIQLSMKQIREFEEYREKRCFPDSKEYDEIGRELNYSVAVAELCTNRLIEYGVCERDENDLSRYKIKDASDEPTPIELIRGPPRKPRNQVDEYGDVMLDDNGDILGPKKAGL